MSCPNCQEKLTFVQEDGQSIFHCANCGASFFEENGINRISTATAAKLSQDKKAEIIMGEQKFCPKDNYPMANIQDNKAIPKTVTLLRCSHCNGIFVYPEDLLMFKNVQESKIKYFKLWGQPIPPLNTVLVLSAVVVFAISLMLTSGVSKNSTTTQTKAHDVVSTVLFTSSGRYTFISFKTNTEMKSQIVISDKQTDVQTTKIVSDSYKTLHYVTTSDINKEESLTYHLVLTAPDGKEILTEEQSVQIK